MAAINSSLPAPAYGNFVTILSIDGGGVKGIIPGVILGYLEAALQKLEENTYLKDYFDVISGASTGGLVTAMLTAPNSEGTNIPLLPATQVADFYKEQCPKIFSNPNADLQSHPKYDGIYLRELIRDKLGDAKLGETLTNVVIPTFELKHLRPTIFSSYKLKKYPNMNDKLSDICIGTSAAPIYLPPYYYENAAEEERNLIDVGVTANPALAAISEVTQNAKRNPELFPLKSPHDYTKILLLSLGTGSTKLAEKYEARPEDTWGYLKWLVQSVDMVKSYPLFECIECAIGDMGDYYVNSIFEAFDVPDNYLRIQEYELPSDISAIDNGSPENMLKLEEAGKKLLTEDVKRLNVQTFEPESIHQGTNAEALDKLADILYQERQQRLANQAKKRVANRN